MDDERLKQGNSLGFDAFGELLERMRDIRVSEKRLYQQIRDIYNLSIHEDPKAESTREFFQIVQNRMHYAVSGMTAAEIIRSRADASKPNIGLTSWNGSKDRRDDVTVAKNHLSGDEIDVLNRIVVMYLDIAELQATRKQPVFMKEWREKLDALLAFNKHQILQHAGTVTAEIAKSLALDQYEIFNRRRLVEEAEREDIQDAVELKRLSERIVRQSQD